MRRIPHQEESQHRDRWLVSYADLLTLLFALFVVLFASAYHDRVSVQRVSASVRSGFEQMGSVPAVLPARSAPGLSGIEKKPATVQAGPTWPPPVVVNMSELRREMVKAFGREIEAKEISIRETPEGFVISLQEVGFFDTGKAQPLPGAEEKIHKLALVLVRFGLSLRIEGHTDNTPIHNATFKSNWDLSTARAMTIADILLRDSSVDPRLISIAAYGEYHPAASNDTAAGRRTNRRVDIVVLSGNGSKLSRTK